MSQTKDKAARRNGTGPGAAPTAVETALHGDVLANKQRSEMLAQVRRSIALQRESLRLDRVGLMRAPEAPLSGMPKEHLEILKQIVADDNATATDRMQAMARLENAMHGKTYAEREAELAGGYAELRDESDEDIWRSATTLVEDPEWSPQQVQ